MTVSARNKLFGVLIVALRTTALLCATGTLMQTFLSTLGFSERWIYLHSTLVQATSMLTILIGVRFADKNLLARAACIQLPTALLFLAYIPLCIWKNASAGSFGLLIGVTVLQTVTTGLYTVCDYKIPYFVYQEQDYGFYLAWAGIAGSVVSFAIGTLVTALTATMDYTDLMLWAFLIAAVLLVISFLLQWHLQPVRDPLSAKRSSAPQAKIPLKDVLLTPVFRKLLAANLMRGFSSGAITVLPVMAITLGYSQAVVTAMVSVQAVATLASCAAFGYVCRWLTPRKTVLAGSICVLALCAMLIPQSAVFLPAYALVLLGKATVDNAVPAALLQIVPAEVAGPYNAWRMILHFFGSLVGTAVAAVIPVPIMLLASALMQLMSGWKYAKMQAI